jgi:hypothetical protein
MACKLAGGCSQCATGFRLCKAAFERLPHTKVALCHAKEGMWLLVDKEKETHRHTAIAGRVCG